MLTPFRAPNTLLTTGLLTISALVPGCASHRATTPPAQAVSLGARHSSYRDYRGQNLCAQNSAQLAAELDDFNALLADFLQGTSAGLQGVWADQHLLLLSEGQKSLPPALEALAATYRGLHRCELDPALGFADLIRRGEELTRQAQQRVQESPELLEFGTARKAVTQWEEAQSSLRETKRARGCKGKQVPGRPTIYYAAEDAVGGREWLFCDGAVVRSRPNAAPEVAAPGGPKRKKPPSDPRWSRPYLEAAAKLPSAELSRAPKLPVKATPPKVPDEPTDPLRDERGID